jgi:hypothetical protein
VEKAPERKSTSENKTEIEIQHEEKGPFQRVGERMDRGAKNLDKNLERGAEQLGRTMQKAGQHLEETAQEAQARRQREEAQRDVPKVDVDVHVEHPNP